MKLWRSTAIACALAGALGVTGNANAITLNETFNGQWAEVGPAGSTTNRGFNIQFIRIAPEQYVGFVTGFVYGDDGSQVWFAGTDGSVIPGDTTVDIDIRQFSGGAPIGGEAIPASTQPIIGSFSMEVNTCNSADVTITAVDGGPFSSGSAAFDRGASTLGIVVGPDQCVYQEAFNGCPSFSTAAPANPGVPARACLIQGTFNEDIVLTNDIVWIMNGPIFIGDPSGMGNSNSVTIEPGTRIVASGTQEREAFIVSRGSKIFSNGVPHGPVVFSSFQATADASPGDFGGLVVNGAAPVNDCPDDDCPGEGNSGTYGGDDPFDSSGIIKYTRIQFGGDSFNPEDQLNGLALQGTGAGTVVDFVQVHANSDDGIEFFGGTTRATHILLTANQDDSLDWTFGWNGSVQYIAVLQSETGDNGIEADNNSGGQTLTPRSQPLIANGTFVGNGATDIGMLIRAGTGVNMTNMIFQGFGDGCLDIDDASTFDQSFNGDGTPNGTLTIENTYLSCGTNFIEEDGDSIDISDFFASQTGNAEFGGFSGLFPSAGASFLSDRPMDPAVFGGLDLVEFAGAFNGEGNAWTAGWTEFLD